MSGRATVLAVALVLAACASNEPKPVEDATLRIARDGFSVLPPGTGWMVALPSDDTVMFWQEAGDPRERFTASVALTPLRTFASPGEMALHTRTFRETALDPRRFKVLRHVERPDAASGPMCVRYDLLAEDLEERPLLLHSAGLVCTHPQAPGLGIDAGYTQRTPAKEVSAALKAETERMVRSLSYAPVEGGGGYGGH